MKTWIYGTYFVVRCGQWAVTFDDSSKASEYAIALGEKTTLSMHTGWYVLPERIAWPAR